MDAFSKITDIGDASGDVEAPPDDAAQLAKVAGLMGKKPAGGADPWRGTLVAAGAKPIKPTIVVGDHRVHRPPRASGDGAEGVERIEGARRRR